MPTYVNVSLSVVHRMYEYLVNLSNDLLNKPSDGITRYFILALYDFMVLRAGFKIHVKDDPNKVVESLRSSVSEVKKLSDKKDYLFLISLMDLANLIRHEFSESDYVKDFKELLEDKENEGVFDRLYASGVLGFDDRLYKFLTSKEFNSVINKDVESYKSSIKKFIRKRVLNLLEDGYSISMVVEGCKKVGFDSSVVNSTIVEYLCSKEVG